MTAVLGILLWILPATPASTCTTNNGKTACGYRCLAAHGDLACAQTPLGICRATSDGATNPGVVCWDPPESVRLHYGDRAPPPDCVMRRGELTCGYRCQASGDNAECAQTPDGVCRASSRGVVCWDPASNLYCAGNGSLPRPQCIVNDGEIACGYNCEARGGQLACAQTPAGRCTYNYGSFECIDPPGPAMCGAMPCDPRTDTRAWCRR
jgi:hypothetical protein